MKLLLGVMWQHSWQRASWWHRIILGCFILFVQLGASAQNSSPLVPTSSHSSITTLQPSTTTTPSNLLDPSHQFIQLPGVIIDKTAKQVITQGIVNMQAGIIELLATTPVGKRHESILVLNCPPHILKAALMCISLNPGTQANWDAPPTQLDGDPIYILVSWELQGKKIQLNASQLIWDRNKKTTMANHSWVFTGSRFIQTESGRPYFGATPGGILVATYYDPDAVINNCLPERNDDTCYEANTQLLPGPGTPVQVIFSAYPAEK